MSIVERELALLRHPRLAALATRAWPAWLWSADSTRIVWANAAGAAIFGAASTSACEQLRFVANDTAAAQIVRLAATLPSGSQDRLERLRGFGAGFGRALTCACARLVLADGKAAILVAATEQAGPAQTLGERVRRLFAGARKASRLSRPTARLFMPMRRRNASFPARPRCRRSASKPSLPPRSRPDAPAERQLDQASFAVAARLGHDTSRVLLITLKQQPSQAPAAPSAAASIEAPPAAMALETAAGPPPPSEPAPAQNSADDEPIAERRHPLRFVWHMDADGRFGVGSDEFIELVGPRTTAAFGRLWAKSPSS